MPGLRIGTRGSPLARWQAGHVADRLGRLDPDLAVEQCVIRTAGDEATARGAGPLETGRGVFVRQIEQALLAGEIDLAVHSLKDMPTEQPPGLAIVAILERHDPRDALITRDGSTFDALPEGAVVGTGSLRRRCQLLHRRPDLRVVPIRGNVDTRARLLSEGKVDALVLALAGIERLALDHLPREPLLPGVCLPAAGQGALALECRAEDRASAALVAPLDHAASRIRVQAERAFLQRLEGGCLAPATAFATLAADRRVRVEALVGDPDGLVLLCERESGPIEEAQRIGFRLAERLLVAGAEQILERCRSGEHGGA